MQITTNAERMVEKAKFNKFHRMLLFWGALLMLFDGYDLVVYGAVVPTLMEEWGISAVQAGMYGSYALFGMMFGALIFGTLAENRSKKDYYDLCVYLQFIYASGSIGSNSRNIWIVSIYYWFRIRRYDAKCYWVN